MNQLTTLFLPDTTRVPETTAGLLLLFKKIFYYLPAEPGPESAGENDLFCKKGLYQGYVPAPLGDDLDRFNRTIRELQTNLYDYGERLKGLSVASLTAERSPDNDETSVSSLVSAILTNHDPKTEKQSSANKERNELWRARIVLKLAESYDREKEEIDARLAEFSRSKDEILIRLTGEDKDEGLGRIPPVPDDGLRTQTDPTRQRIKAWSRLFLADAENNQTHVPYILSTTRRDVVELLFDAYEERCKQQPVILFSLPFPDLQGMTGDEFVSNCDAFRTDARNILDHVHKLLMDTATGITPCPAGEDDQALDPDRITAWTETLGGHFPSPAGNHGRLTVYCLDNTPLADLLAPSQQTTGNDKSTPGPYPTGLIALLNK